MDVFHRHVTSFVIPNLILWAAIKLIARVWVGVWTYRWRAGCPSV